MASLSDGQLAQLARDAGWRGRDLVTAVAVALAESGGRTDARGDTGITTDKWGPSIGLWQIRSLNAEKGTGGLRDEVANVDPKTNAAHAFQIWSQQGWGPWSTHNTGRHYLYWPRAAAAVTNLGEIAAGAAGGVGGVVAGEVIDSTPAALVDIAREPLRFLEWLKQPINVERIGQVLIGGVALLIGLTIVALGTRPGKSAGSLMPKGVKDVTKIVKGKG